MAADVGVICLGVGVGVEGDFVLTGNDVLFDVVENVPHGSGRGVVFLVPAHRLQHSKTADG